MVENGKGVVKNGKYMWKYKFHYKYTEHLRQFRSYFNFKVKKVK